MCVDTIKCVYAGGALGSGLGAVAGFMLAGPLGGMLLGGFGAFIGVIVAVLKFKPSPPAQGRGRENPSKGLSILLF